MFMFTGGLIVYSKGVIIDYTRAIDGMQVRNPQRRTWINNQRRLDLAMKLYNEGRYSILEFLTSVKHQILALHALNQQLKNQ